MYCLETTCPLNHDLNGFVATGALEHLVPYDADWEHISHI